MDQPLAGRPDQGILVHRGNFLTVSVGDTFPKGLHFENRSLGMGRVIYPDPDRKKDYDADSTHLGSMASVGGNVGLRVSVPSLRSG